MPSLIDDTPSQMATATVSKPITPDVQHGRNSDKTSVGNAFLWTDRRNGDTSHQDGHPYNQQLATGLTNGSAYSLNGPRSSISSYSREASFSKDGTANTLENGISRDRYDGGRGSIVHDQSSSRTYTEAVTTAALGRSSSSNQLANGDSATPQSINGKAHTNGDLHHHNDGTGSSDTATKGVRSGLSASQTEGQLSSDVDRLAPPQRARSHRHSSPPAPSSVDEARNPDTVGGGLRQRHTLSVPRTSIGHRNSRDQTSEDGGPSSDRLSPTTPGIRRTSFSLVRRSTRTDIYLDEAPPDEDAARWAEAIMQKRASRRRRRDEEDDDRVIVGTKVDQNHVNWVTAYNMLTGIRFTVSRINAKMDRELTSADFEAKHKFSFDITGNELTPSAKYDFKFKDYAPWVFRHLRAKFRLDPADYLVSLTSKYILSELGSPGKSGSFFYFSRDYKYIIKTIHHAEHKLLRKILPEYYKHVENNPNTLISQFYGLHRVKMAYGRKIHFVVMNNLFPPHRDIHQTFDLKGSTIGRDLREEDLEKNPRATLKDLNWVRRNRHLECGPGKRNIFIAQLKRDVELLKRLKIMDYSLLVGIHDLGRGNEEKLRDKTLRVFQPGGDREEGPSPNMLMRTPSKLEHERKARELRMLIKKERPVPLDQATNKMPEEILDERKYHIFYSDDGGFRATHQNGQPGEEIYYLGVIDCLTHYGLVKKMEHFIKGLSHDRTQISPVPPELYGDRFINFITGITMSKEEAEEKQQANQTVERDSVDRRSWTSSVDRTMQKAEKQAAKDPSPVHSRTLSTVWDPTDAGGSGPPSTLPIVDEAGEANSIGGRSQHSRQGLPGPVPEANELPPLPDNEKGKERST